MDFDSIESFIRYQKQMIEQSAKIPMEEIKKKAQEIVENEIYGAYSPKIYQRMGELTEHFKIEYEWQGDTYVCTLYVENAIHPYNPTWNGEAYPFDEIINEYFVRGGWGNGSPRDGVDTLGLTQEEMIETGEAMRILLNELRKYFDIV